MVEDILNIFLKLFFGGLLSILAAASIVLLELTFKISLKMYMEWIEKQKKSFWGRTYVLGSVLAIAYLFALSIPLILDILDSISTHIKDLKLDEVSYSGGDKLFILFCCFIFVGVLVPWRWSEFKRGKGED